MTLNIAAIAHSHWEPLKPALKALGWPETQSDPEQWWSANHGHGSQGTYLLLHTRPELAMARALAAGEDLEQAFTNWEAATERLLAFYQAHRNQAALVDVAAASAKPRALVTWLAENHPAFTELTVPTSLECSQKPETPSPTLLLIATQFLVSVPDLDLKLGKLEAMSVPLNQEGYVPPPVDLNDALNDIQQSQNSWSRLQARIAELEKQVKQAEASNIQIDADRQEQVHLLELQLQQTQDALENVTREREQLSRQVESSQGIEHKLRETQQELERAQEKLKVMEDSLTTDLDDTRDLNELLILQLHQVQEEMEERYLREQKLIEVKSQLESKVADKNRKLQRLSASKNAALQQITDLKRSLKAVEHGRRLLTGELERLQKSASWRLSSPLRAITGVVKVVHEPSRRHKTLLEQAKLIEESGLFDSGWYLEKYPDVASESISPAQHYLAHGAQEGRDPSERFSTKWYLKKNKDVAQSGMNPLLHYLIYGKEEGRKPSPQAKA